MSSVISVSQFNNYVHNIFLAEELLQNISIYGEVSGLSISGANLYFSIKDDNAVLNCVKFGVGSGYVPKEGDLVAVLGSPNYYIKGGRFSFNVVKIEPYGQGALYKQFLELKLKLERLGMFDQEKKKALPTTIKRVGVIASETGAVIQDIIDIVGRRNPMLDIVLYPAKVQGVGAEQTIIAGLKALDITNVDVIIIARGGGSAEDLSTFNSEDLAYAIFKTQTPVISAVGHETDFTISDFVADLRAPTPSAAAEIVAIDLRQMTRTLGNNANRLISLLDDYYDARVAEISNLITHLNLHMENYSTRNRGILDNLILRLNNSLDVSLNNIYHRLDIKTNKLESLNPIRLLKIGYSQANINGKVVSSIKDVNANDELKLMVSDGEIKCIVKSKSEVKL